MGVASLVLGIISIVMGVFAAALLGWLGAILGVIGIVLGALGRKQLTQQGTPNGIATAGMVCSIIGTVLSVLFYIACVACASGAGSAVKSLF